MSAESFFSGGRFRFRIQPTQQLTSQLNHMDAASNLNAESPAVSNAGDSLSVHCDTPRLTSSTESISGDSHSFDMSPIFADRVRGSTMDLPLLGSPDSKVRSNLCDHCQPPISEYQPSHLLRRFAQMRLNRRRNRSYDYLCPTMKYNDRIRRVSI